MSITLDRTSILRQDEITKRYLDEVSSFDMISHEEFLELFAKYKRGDCSAAEKILKANLRFVVSAAKSYQNSGVPLNDLISAGNVGLVVALEKYDPTRGDKKNGVTFISLAVFYIRRELASVVDTYTNPIKLSVKLKQEIKESKKIKNNTYESFITNKEVSKPVVASLNEKIDDNSSEFGSIIGNHDKCFDPDNKYEFEALHKAINLLSDVEKEIVQYKFGINTDYQLNFKEISDVMDLKPNIVRNKFGMALIKIRKLLKSHKNNLIF